jgi:hypothetical protein
MSFNRTIQLMIGLTISQDNKDILENASLDNLKQLLAVIRAALFTRTFGYL